MDSNKLLVTYLCVVQCQVQPFEIIGLDRLLDNSLGSMNEDHSAGELVDTSEQEEMHHDNTNVSFPLYLTVLISSFTFLKYTK